MMLSALHSHDSSTPSPFLNMHSQNKSVLLQTHLSFLTCFLQRSLSFALIMRYFMSAMLLCHFCLCFVLRGLFAYSEGFPARGGGVPDSVMGLLRSEAMSYGMLMSPVPRSLHGVHQYQHLEGSIPRKGGFPVSPCSLNSPHKFRGRASKKPLVKQGISDTPPPKFGGVADSPPSLGVAVSEIPLFYSVF